jgi:protoporphyrinogen oxidase
MTRVESADGAGAPWRVTAESGDRSETFEADHVWSTIPVTVLARSLDPAPPAEVLEAAGRIGYRSMILIYARLGVDQFTEFDAHYFPGADTRITRMSEPKNYAALREPAGSTVLCAELPCQAGDEVWSMSDEELGELFARDVAGAGIPFPAPPVEVWTRRLPQAYPVYLMGYEEPFERLDRWVDGVPGVLSYGRQGLFAHDNTHHALAMAYRAVECLDGGKFDAAAWARHREEFARHVVED